MSFHGILPLVTYRVPPWAGTRRRRPDEGMFSGRPDTCDAAGRRAVYCARGCLHVGADFHVHDVGRVSRLSRSALPRSHAPHGEVKVQEDFKELGTVTLDRLDVYITKL